MLHRHRTEDRLGSLPTHGHPNINSHRFDLDYGADDREQKPSEVQVIGR